MTSTRLPIVVVLGATGAGKSKLALEIAQKFGGEIISADAMQMYRGLDIVTNKVTQAERNLVKHHMIDFLDPLLKSTVVDFRNQALPLIDEMRTIGKMPVICGGTNYYIESLLWDVLVETKGDTSTMEPITKKIKKDDVNEETELDSKELYEKLKQIDPDRANELHPNERRKIIRSLQVFEQEGKKHSLLLEEQRQSGGLLGGGLRYPKDQLLIFWVQCEQPILEQRCDKRVDQMIAQGLLGEMQLFHEDFNKKRLASDDSSTPDYTVGIFQSIGFKEFHDYLLLGVQEQGCPLGQKLFKEGKDQMMLATRQYARRQVKWIRQRFLRNGIDRQCPPVYGVNSDQPSEWEESVRHPAFEIVEAYMNGVGVLGHQPLPCTASAHSFEATRQTFNCQHCNVTLKGKIQYEAHINSRRHKKTVASQKKKARRTEPSSTPASIIVLRLGLLKRPCSPQSVDGENEDNGHEKASRLQLLAILRDVTGLSLQNIKTALLQEPLSNENAIELHFPVRAPSDPSLSDNHDAYIKYVKERFSNVQHHVKVLAVDIKEHFQ